MRALKFLIKLKVYDLISAALALRMANRILAQRILISALTNKNLPVFLEKHFAFVEIINVIAQW